MSENDKKSGANPNSREALEKAAMQDEHMQDVHAQLLREKEEPHEGFSPVPIFLMFVFAALCFWGGVYLVEYSGDFRADVYSPHYDPNANKPVRAEVSLYDHGKKIFSKNCVACHQATGLGVAGVWPPLAGSEWVTGHPEVTARILINGLNGPIEVAGNTYNGAMPAFGPGGFALKDKDIAGVITYIRQEWGNTESDVTVQMIADYTAEYKGRSAPWTAAELKEGLGPIPEAAPVVDEAAVEAEGDDAGEAAAHGESDAQAEAAAH